MTMTITNFAYNNLEVRTIEIDGCPWFVAKDVCDVLEIKNVSQAVSRLDDDETEIITNDTRFDNWETVIISESGLYSLILRSRKPEAKAFKRWVTHEVLPAIRRYCMYAIPKAVEDLSNNPDAIAAILDALKAEQNKRVAAEQETAQKQRQIEADMPKVAFADAVMVSDATITIYELAKLISQNGVEIGGMQLLQIMRDHRYLCKQHGSQWNVPTQRAIAAGLLEIRIARVTRNGCVTIRKTPGVTGKGQAYFVNLFLKRAAGKSASVNKGTSCEKQKQTTLF